MEPEKRLATQLIELMRDSVITQAIITIMALGATLIIVAEGRSVPGELWAIDGLVVGFYFGGKVQSGAARLIEKHMATDAAASARPAHRARSAKPAAGRER